MPEQRNESPAASTVVGCAHPERCGSDGDSCCHHDCQYRVNLEDERDRRERLIRRYQRRARAAVRVLQKHGLAHEYLDAYESLGGEDG